MSKKGLLSIFIIYLIMLGLNCLAPLYYGDDLVYAFIWQNQFMNIPLPEAAERVSCMQDIFLSQWRHYLTGNGRTIAHLFVQFFIWQGKGLFNIFNALMFVILILQIHWISDGGKISFNNLRVERIWWIFFVLWTFVVGFWSVYLWLAGSCNYLWSMVFLLFFLLPYIQNYIQDEKKLFQSIKEKSAFFILGLCSGWGNENTICWIILVLGYWLLKLMRNKKLEDWMVGGYIALCVGYSLLMLAPGNTVKTQYYLANYFSNNWVNVYSWEFLKSRLFHFGIIEYWQIFLWYYILTSLNKLRKEKLTPLVVKYINLSKLFCFLNLLVNAIMIFTPDFPLRSGFASLVFNTISASLIIRIQFLTRQSFITSNAKKLISLVGCIVFMITFIYTYKGAYLIAQYDENLKKMITIYKGKKKESVLEIPQFTKISDTLNWASGQHLMQPELSEDHNDWRNVAVARYYGIKGIRTLKIK